MQSEVILANLPSDNEDERLQLVLSQGRGAAALTLLQQTWAEGVGWYTQNALELSPSQVRQLRLALGQPGASPAAASIPMAGPAADVISVPFVTARAESA